MDIQEIIKRIKRIKEKAGDSEVAHGIEDTLYLDVLEAIAAGAENAKELATEALKAKSIAFERWYA